MKTSPAPLPVLALLVLLLAGTAYSRNTVWSSRLSLWEDAVVKSSLRPRAHNNLGQAYSMNGRFAEARRQYRIALALNPDYAEAYFNLGVSYLMTEDLREAGTAFELAVRKEPGMRRAQEMRKYVMMLDSPKP